MSGGARTPNVENMNPTSLPVYAGILSTVIFASSTLPMLAKALRTRDLGSYSLGNLVLANAGNAVYSIYVVSLPLGPIWFLHAFNQATTAFMLIWFLRFARRSDVSGDELGSPYSRQRLDTSST
jgi:hypothetical protein